MAGREEEGSEKQLVVRGWARLHPLEPAGSTR